MYKVLVFLGNDFGYIEEQLNAFRADGYKPVHFWNLDSRMVCILEMQPRPGRPPKGKESEASLGE